MRRIFCLGESTMAGFPYDFHATAPSFLADRLQQMFPEDTIEVINVGLSAIGSYVILDFLRELAEYSPDLFIVYTGHNEFYGDLWGRIIAGPGERMGDRTDDRVAPVQNLPSGAEPVRFGVLISEARRCAGWHAHGTGGRERCHTSGFAGV